MKKVDSAAANGHGPTSHAPGLRILGIDPGDARFGVAVSDELGMLAHPVETIHLSKTDPLRRITELAASLKVASVVGVNT